LLEKEKKAAEKKPDATVNLGRKSGEKKSEEKKPDENKPEDKPKPPQAAVTGAVMDFSAYTVALLSGGAL